MAKLDDFDGFLNERGRGVLDFIRKHCQAIGIWKDEYVLEATMLANSFSLYRDAATWCNKPGGTHQEVGDNGYVQVSVYYTIMKNEYQNILKHAPKFGLNPADMKRAFASMEPEKPKKGFNLDGKMKVA